MEYHKRIAMNTADGGEGEKLWFKSTSDKPSFLPLKVLLVINYFGIF